MDKSLDQLYTYFKLFWRVLVPHLTDTSRDVVRIYSENYPRKLKTYEVYVKSPHQLSTVYKAVKSLRRRWLVICDEGGCAATVKAPLTLIYHGELDALRHVKKIWNIEEISDESLMAYLVLVGAALKRLEFDITQAYICPAWGAAMYVASFIRGGFKSLENSLGVPGEVLRLAYPTHVKILDPYLAPVDGVRLLVRRRGAWLDLIAARCPAYPGCGHVEVDNCPFVKKALERLNATL
ncbi:MAG: hypothetical protein ACP5J3_06100 [Pyrobaculum sp.]